MVETYVAVGEKEDKTIENHFYDINENTKRKIEEKTGIQKMVSHKKKNIIKTVRKRQRGEKQITIQKNYELD